MQTLKEGERFGSYRVVRRLGKGGMGEVWLLQSASDGLVAVKILEATDHESRKRFLREAELALGVKHPNLVETYDVGEDPDTGLCYILMEYMPGGTLADYLKANGAMPIEDAVAVIEAMADVLELGRKKGVVHRDIKPANIMFAADGTPKLADLGIARGGEGTETTTVTQTGTMIGTPAYMSPEQMLDAHSVDTRADIYSLGVVFFEMLTGERPNKDDTVIQLMAKAVKGTPLPDVRTLRPEVSAALAQLLNMMVVPDKDGRISTPGQITNALAIIERGGEFASAARQKRRERKILTAVAACTLLLGLVFVGTLAYCLWPKDVKDEKAPMEVNPQAVPKKIIPHTPPRLHPADIFEGVAIDIAPSCVSCAETVSNWTAEVIGELKRQVGTAAYEEKLSKVDNRIVVRPSDDKPGEGWYWPDKDYGERFAFTTPKRTAAMCIVPGWKGFPNESAHGYFVVCAAQMASGLHYDLAQAELTPIAWGLKDALGITVARRLGYDDAADKLLDYLKCRAGDVVRSKGVQPGDVMLEAKPRPGAKVQNPQAYGHYTWIVEYRIAKFFSDLMREKPDVMRDYFAVRNEYRRTHGGDKVRIDAQTFAELLGRVTGRDIFTALGVSRGDKSAGVAENPASRLGASRQVAPNADLLKGITINVYPSCAHNASAITNLTIETVGELRRQLGTAYDEVRPTYDTEIIVCREDERPEGRWGKLTDGAFVNWKADVGNQNRRKCWICFTKGWDGMPNKPMYGVFSLIVAHEASGLYPNLAHAEYYALAYSLMDVTAISVVRRLGYADAEKLWFDRMNFLQKLALDRTGVELSDVTLDARLRPGSVSKNSDMSILAWIVEHRVTTLFCELMVENPDILRDFFIVRNAFRKSPQCKNGVVTAEDFTRLLSQVAGRDLTHILNPKPVKSAKAEEKRAEEKKTEGLKAIRIADMEKKDVRGLKVYVSPRLSAQHRNIAMNVIRVTLDECYRVAGEFQREVLKSSYACIALCGPGECIFTGNKYAHADGHAAVSVKRGMRIEVLDTWAGYANAARRGSLVRSLAEAVSGLQGNDTRCENPFVAFGLQSAFSSVVANNLSYHRDVEEWLAAMQKRYDDCVRIPEGKCGPVSLDGTFAKDAGKNADLLATWAVELRVVKAVAQFERENPGTLKRYFELRQRYRAKLPDDKAQIPTRAFLKMMSKAAGRDVSRELQPTATAR